MNVGRGVAVVVAVVGFSTCAPAWASTEAGPANTMRGVRPVLGRLPSSAVGNLSASARQASVSRTVRAATATRRPKGHLTLTPTSLTYHGGHVKLSWSGSNAKVCTLSSKPRFWSGPDPARVKCRGKLTAKLPALAVGVHWRFTFKAKSAKGKRASTVRRTLVLHKPPFPVSSNWSGYVVPSATPVTSVSGEFTVPTLDCAKTRNAGVAAWVGIGGVRSADDLLQTGVVSECVAGVQTEDPGWWEEYPENAAQFFTNMPISPGDQIEASVSQGADLSWTTRVDDLTTKVSGVMHTGTGGQWGTIRDADGAPLSPPQDSSTFTYAGGGTAEWIVEDFGNSIGLVPFADFGTVTFTGLTTSLPAWGLTADEQVGLGDRAGLLLAEPSAPDSSGKGFSVAYTG
ncbi:MAG TPA: G1 family glutamic endopeptidase [Gaiellaceae bacterium]|nr:G1 family glutamic endopeptidase [Gaiellaceae bacterium]